MVKKFFSTLFIICILSGITAMALLAMEKKDKKKEDLFKEISLFSDTLAVIQTDYVDEVKTKDLIYGALKGIISSLDPHSQFMDPDTYNELKVDTEGKFGGLGIEISIKDGLLTVVTPIEDTPAWKAGVKSLDRIVKINNEVTRDMTISEAVKKLRGKVGEAVNLTVLRESEKKLIEIKVVRDIIKIKDIKEAKILEDGIAYIKLLEFREGTVNDLAITLEKLKKDGMNSLILDLRNNPGGLLESAVGVTENFIEKDKLVVNTKGRVANQNMEFYSQSKKPILDIPMVVMINEGSASGSEIVAGALQDYKRAVIVGVKSYGKGSVQTVIPLSDGSALRLTTSKYFTPSGKVIHGNGVLPDIVVELDNKKIKDKEDKDKTKDEIIADEIFEKLEEPKTVDKNLNQFDYKKDNQLMQSIATLKAIKIYKASNK